jgi:hypothetical protein
MDIIRRSSIWAASVASNNRQSWRQSWLSKLSHVSAPGAVARMVRPGTRHFGRVSSAAVEAGLVAFFLERVLDLAMESESGVGERLLAALRVRGDMRDGNE